MKKLMIAIAGAMAIGFSANAGNETWFDGGVTNAWPKDTTMVGGEWTNITDQAEFNSTTQKLEIFADATNAVEFALGDNAKQLGGDAIKLSFSAKLEFASHESIDGVSTDGKAGICVVSNADENCVVYVLERDSTTNAWTDSNISLANLDMVDVSVVVTNGVVEDEVQYGSAVYTIGSSTFGPVDIALDGTSAGTFSKVLFAGDGYLKSLKGELDDGTRDMTLPALPANVASNVVYQTGEPLEKEGGKYQVGVGESVEIWYFAAPGHYFDGGATSNCVWNETIEADGTYDLSGQTFDAPTKTAEAQNGNDYFYTLTNALDVAQATETVKLLKVAYYSGIAVKDGVTLDLNKQTLNVTSVSNAGTIVVYTTEQAEFLKDLTGTLKAGVTLVGKQDSTLVYVYPSNTTVTCEKELVKSDENENILVKQTITVGDDKLGTNELYWANVINPYQQVTVNGKAKFAGAAVSAGLSEKLTSKLIVNGNLEITKDVAVGNYAELKVTGTLTTNSKTITIGDKAGINSKFTCKKDTVVTVASGATGYAVAKATGDDYDVYTLGQTFDITITDPITGKGTIETSATNGITVGTSVTVTLTPATGYAAGTITTNGQTLAGNTFVMPAENVTVAATFTAETYEISYYDCEGASALEPKSYTIETETFNLPAVPFKEHCAAGSWTNAAGETCTQIVKGSTGNKAFYAVYAANEFQVSWVDSKNVVVSNETSAAVEVSGTSGWFAENAVLKFYATEGSITNVTVNGKTETVANPFPYTVQKSDSVQTIVVLAGQESSGPVTPPTGGGSVTPVTDEPGVYVVQADTSSKTVTITSGLKETDTIRVTTADDITVVGVPANQIQVKINGVTIDNTAFVGGDESGFSTALSETGYAMVDEVKVDVKTSITEADSSAGAISDGAVATKVIPGLTYELKRGTSIGSYDTITGATTAKKTAGQSDRTLTLVDDTTKPTEKAFYVIEVMK